MAGEELLFPAELSNGETGVLKDYERVLLADMTRVCKTEKRSVEYHPHCLRKRKKIELNFTR